MKTFLIITIYFLSTRASPPPARAVETELEELLEMIPFDQMMRLSMEYTMEDPQVKKFFGYISSDIFKNNIVNLESSQQFSKLAEQVSKVYQMDAYHLVNKINTVLDVPQLDRYKNNKEVRTKRSPGDGVVGLIKEVIEITPLDEMKKAYQYKVASNPKFEELIGRVISGEAKQYWEPLVSSKPFQDTKRDLETLGIPLAEIEAFLEHKLIDFLDLGHQPSPVFGLPETA